ncbi:MAG: heavy-metal-associated domain-containing protein [Sulfolobaceae archaeon]
MGYKLTFIVTNIFCDNCVYRVRKALKSLSEVESIEISPDFDKNIAKVTLITNKEIKRSEIEELLVELSKETPYHEYKAIWE